MAERTNVTQRLLFYQRHLNGESYATIGEAYQVSRECVRYWCRRQRERADVFTVYQRKPAGILSRFDPFVRYAILRLRLKHRRWGPGRILIQLRKRSCLRGKNLPSESQIGRYLHQWPRFRRQQKPALSRKRPPQPSHVHQRWQLDFKTGIALQNGLLINMHTVRDPLGEACLGARIYAAGKTGRAPKGIRAEEVRNTLRWCFAHWGTLPEEVQTDGESTICAQRRWNDFPTTFTLWLKGLGIEHLIIRPGRPTDNAEVERCHRTITDYAIIGNEQADQETLQTILDQAVAEHVFELPSRAQGCGGRTPIEAHPELLRAPHPYQPEWELACFDIQRVYHYLNRFTWTRKVSGTGQVYLGDRRYTVGRSFARRQASIRFDPQDQNYAFFDPEKPPQEQEIIRRPALGLTPAELTGLHDPSEDLVPQQLPLPWLWSVEKAGVYYE